MKMIRVVLASALATTTSIAIACGVCIEDKVAAVYDHAVLQQAVQARHLVLFCELNGPFESRVLARRAKQAAEALPNVDRASVRVSEELPALSFAMDPARQSADATVQAIANRLAAEGISVKLLRTMPSPLPAAALLKQ